MNRRDPGFDVWVVVADVLIGFLCVVFLLFVAQAGPVGLRPPEDVGQFATEMNELKIKRGGKYGVRSEFSKVHLTYGEKLLFQQCEWNLSPGGIDLLEEHFQVFQSFAAAISRIQIEGHADSRPAAKCPSLQRVGLKRDNWILSSLRAHAVRDVLENVLAAGAQGKHGDLQGTGMTLLKALEAVGRGDLPPVRPDAPANEENRRIEITIHFKESGGR